MKYEIKKIAEMKADDTPTPEDTIYVYLEDRGGNRITLRCKAKDTVWSIADLTPDGELKLHRSLPSDIGLSITEETKRINVQG